MQTIDEIAPFDAQGGILAGAAQEAPRTASGAKLPKWLKPKK